MEKYIFLGKKEATVHSTGVFILTYNIACILCINVYIKHLLLENYIDFLIFLRKNIVIHTMSIENDTAKPR